MKLGENDYLMRSLLAPSFMMIEQKMWISYQDFNSLLKDNSSLLQNAQLNLVLIAFYNSKVRTQKCGHSRLFQ